MKRRWIVTAILMLIAVGAVFSYLYADRVYLPEKRLDTAEEEQSELFKQVKPDVEYPTATETTDNAAEETETEENPLTAAEEVNDSTVGWIYIPDTYIDYPIVQGEDNDFYLHNGFDGEYNYELGCPFLDYRCDGDFSGFNSIVYAHHMTRRRMFADIALFKEESFMQTHPTGYLTLPDGVHTVQFFAYLTVSSTAPAYHAVFVMDSEKRDYIDYIYSAAKYSQEIDIDENSHLLLLSTCTFEYDEARGILVGVIN